MAYNYNLRTWAEIDTDAVMKNFSLIRKCFSDKAMVMAVIKADAYGHGACHIAKLLSGKADYFGVARIDEAVELRLNGICDTDILILGHTAPCHYPVLFRHNIIPTIYSIEEAKSLSAAADEAGCKVRIHVAVDTGMSRIGFEPSEDGALSVEEISKLGSIVIEGIFSHFADADNSSDRSFTFLQLQRFRRFCEKLEKLGVKIPIRHLYNSAGIISLPNEFEMVREGICLYGLSPSDSVGLDGLMPAMSLRSEIIHIHTVSANTPVSYGCTFVSKKRMKIATVCAGYADGVPRLLSNRGEVLINGKRAPIVGRICMDQFMCDVTEIENAEVGSVVTIFGSDENEFISADETARHAETISYEILCGISKRVPRVYLKNGEVCDIHYGIPHED